MFIEETTAASAPWQGWDGRRVGERARMADVVRARCHGLPPDDASLLRSVFVASQTVVEVARLSGQPTHQVRSRVHRLVRRVTQPEFALVLAGRDAWTATRRNVGEACFLQGLSIKAAADKLGMSPHQVRRHREAITALSAK